MNRTAALAATALLPWTVACGSSSYADITGQVAGHKLNPSTAMWGGPFLVFTTLEQDCLDMAWVERGQRFETGGTAPVDQDMVALLFTFSDTDVKGGTNVSLEGESPVDARLLVVEGDALTVYNGREGELVVNEASEGDPAIGSFAVGFDEGQMTGEFEIEFCTNLDAAY